MDPLSLAVGAALLAVGFLAGRIGRAGRRPPDEQPICGCTHHRSMHDPESGTCRARIKLGNWFDGYHHQTCRCRQYSGPVPIIDLWTPPVLPAAKEET
jgi:hypothetical protein